MPEHGKTPRRRRWFARPDAPRFAGSDATRTLSTGNAACMALELRVAEVVCHDLAHVDGTLPQGAARLTRCAGPAAVLATAYGWASTGRRVAAFLPSRATPTVLGQLQTLVERRIPLVLYVSVGERSEIEMLESSGALLAVPADVQQAVDCGLVARRVAESTLTPAVVALDENDIAWSLGDLVAPPVELVREWLGDARDAVDAPSPAQRLLFGERRRRVPRWFDPRRPTAHGVDLAPGPEGRRFYFAAQVAPALADALDAFAKLTGRDAGKTARLGSDKARHLVVARGSAIGPVAAALDRLSRKERADVAAVDLVWTRPWDPAALAEPLSRAQRVTVLERGDGDVSRLWQQVRALLPVTAPAPIRAGFDRLTVEHVAAVLDNMRSAEARGELLLGESDAAGPSAFPKREALLQRLRRDYPELSAAVTRGRRVPQKPDAGHQTVALFAETLAGALELQRLAGERLAPTPGARARGEVRRLDSGWWHVRLTVAHQPVRVGDPGPGAAVVLIADVPRALAAALPLDAAPGGALILGSTLDPAAWAGALPRVWGETIERLDLRVFCLAQGDGPVPARLVDAARACLAGTAGDLPALSRAELTATGGSDVDLVPPLAVRRFGDTGEAYDNVARFWGEYAQPRLAGEVAGELPDPYLALGSVPAATATLHDRTAGRETLPVIDPERCSGCGRCWASCPDAAIGPLAIGVEALLDAVAPESSDAAAAKLRRAHKQLAARVNQLVAKADVRRLAPQTLREACAWLTDKLEIGVDERAPVDRALEQVRSAVEALPLSVTEPFFDRPRRERKGTEELLLLAVNPQSCQGCGICAFECPEQAIRIEPQTHELIAASRRTWEAWERLPDTTGATIARAADDPQVGPLAAVSLSRHCLFALAGGDGAEPGSGERLAVRHAAAVTEYEMQRRTLERVVELDRLAEGLTEAVRKELSQPLGIDDMARLDAAVRGLSGDAAPVDELLARLREQGQGSTVDLQRIHALAEVAQDLGRLRRQLIHGDRGTGRARYGVVVRRGESGSWAARFPRNPWSVPVTTDIGGCGSDVAAGVMESLLLQHVDETRLLRRAKLLLDNPSDHKARERELDGLVSSDLTPDELRTLPPLLLLADSAAFTAEVDPGLTRLLRGPLPVKVLLLDPCDLTSRCADALLLALAHRSAFVVSSSVSEPRHFFDGVQDALRHAGPALIRVHAPSPSAHGYETSRTVERARSAVACRVQPLLTYDPTSAGVFGLRLSLDGNPHPDRPWSVDEDGNELTPAVWAAGEARFKDLNLLPDARGSTHPTVPGPNGRDLALGEMSVRAVAERQELWATLQELAGVVTPFTATLRQQLQDEFAAAHQAELDELRHDYEARLAHQQREATAMQAERLRRRLLQLAGYPPRNS